MSRIATTFKRLREVGRKALVPYVTAGDPDPDVTVPVMHAMVEAGASIIELGVPFSDPMADGPVIQRATERALMHGVTLDNVLDMVREFRAQDDTTPVVLMGYLNPVEVMGYARFAQKAAEAGVDGVLTVDLPPEEGGPLLEALRAHDLDAIFLVAPTTDDTRIRAISDAAGGFVYYVSLKGVTGAANLDVDSVAGRVGHIRSLTDLPVGVGFGIKDAAAAAAVGAFADAVVVGSVLVKIFERHADAPQAIGAEVSALIGDLRAAMDA